MDPRLMGRAKKYSKDLNQFLSKFMICQTVMSKFFDLPIIPLPEMKVQEWPCSFNSKYLKSIEICEEQTETELRNDYDGWMARWVKQGW